MRIAVLSDTHSRLQTIETALQSVRERGIDLILHCGDIEDASAVELFRGFTVHFVFGNCDHDRRELRAAMKKIGAHPHEPYGLLELDGKQIGWVHGDDDALLRDLEK